MLICIPTEGNEGLEAKVFGHFGSAPCFTLCDTETDETTVLDNRNAHHDHGTCHPMNQLGKHKIDCVVCGGMGRRAIEALGVEGIKVYLAQDETVRDTVAKMKNNGLTEIDPATACRGHGQQGGCSHVTPPTANAGSGQGRGAGYGRGGGRGQGGGRGRSGN